MRAQSGRAHAGQLVGGARMTPAGKLQAYLKARVQATGGVYRKFRYESRRGCPDCLVWWRWPALALIEIKAEDGDYKDRYSALQQREVDRMRDAGLPVYTARTKADIDRIVEEVRNRVAI